MCKVAADESKILTLYPADMDDLDRLMARRNDEDLRWAGDLVGMPREEAVGLLDDLVDYQHASQQFVLGVLGVNVVLTRAAGGKMFQLLQSRTMSPTVHRDVEAMLQSLQNVIERMRSQMDKLDLRNADLKRRYASFRRDKELLVQEKESFKVYEANVHKKESQLAAKSDEVIQARANLMTEGMALEQKTKAVQEQEDKAREEVRRAQSEAMKARIEARQLVAAKEDEVQARLTQMTQRMQEAEKRQREAEAERDHHRRKEHVMSEQMRAMAVKLKESRAALSSEKTKRKEDKAEREKMEAKVAQLSSEATAGPSSENASLQSAVEKRGGSTALTSSPSAVLDWSDDNLLASSSQQADLISTGTQSLILVESRSNPKHRNQRALRSFGIEGDDSDGDDDLPMPGLPSRRKYQKTNPASSRRSGSGASMAENRSGSSATGTTKDQNDQLRKWMAPFVNRATKGIVTGPRQKIRDGS